MPHVLVAGRIHEAGLDLLRATPGVTLECVEEVSTEAYAPLVGRADAILIRTQPMPAAVIAEAPQLQIVSRHGVGFDAVDVGALNERGIPLAIAGDVNAVEEITSAGGRVEAAEDVDEQRSERERLRKGALQGGGAFRAVKARGAGRQPDAGAPRAGRQRCVDRAAGSAG